MHYSSNDIVSCKNNTTSILIGTKLGQTQNRNPNVPDIRSTLMMGLTWNWLASTLCVALQ